jgi:hypothetical protein
MTYTTKVESRSHSLVPRKWKILLRLFFPFAFLAHVISIYKFRKRCIRYIETRDRTTILQRTCLIKCCLSMPINLLLMGVVIFFICANCMASIVQFTTICGNSVITHVFYAPIVLINFLNNR